MDKLMQILQLSLPLLTPKDICKLKCTCSELQDVSVSWQDHSIDFKLDGSASAVSWLHKNIVSVTTLELEITVGLPLKMLQDVMR